MIPSIEERQVRPCYSCAFLNVGDYYNCNICRDEFGLRNAKVGNHNYAVIDEPTCKCDYNFSDDEIFELMIEHNKVK